jgi:DNA-binding response OmpR family regulator
MSKILLIEPERILKQAITLFLFPEHEVEETSSQSADSSTLKEYDLLIIDGSALRDRNHLTQEFTRTVQGSDTPTVWLGEDESSLPFAREKLLFIKKPIEREEFLAAMDSLISPETPRKSGGDGSGPRDGQKQTKGEQKDAQFIELEDVVSMKAPPRESKNSKSENGKSGKQTRK